MTETILIRNRTGRDITLSYVMSRQSVEHKGGEKVTHPVHSISHTLAKAKTSEIPQVVWDSQKTTALVQHYLQCDPPKLEVVDKNAQASVSTQEQPDKAEHFDPEQIDLVREALGILAEDGNDKPTLKELSKEVGFKVVSAMRDAALADGES